MKRFVPIFALCALYACGGQPAQDGAPSQAELAAVSVETVDLAGLERALAARRGRPLILNFWAMW